MRAHPARRVKWGQNFLADDNVARAIVEWAGIEGRSVIEIGPGRGALTGLLRERASRLCLIEIDPGMAADWTARFAGDSAVRVIAGDVLDLDLEALLEAPVSVVANLPYESGTAILMRLLECGVAIETMVVMLQKEVCERIVAREGDSAYGLLSVHTTLVADVTAGRIVSPSCFRPQPKVQSQVLRIEPLPRPRYAIGDRRVFGALVRAAFGTRRKMLRNSLGPWLAARLGREQVAAAFAAADIEPSLRAQAISVQAFARLSSYVCRSGARDA